MKVAELLTEGTWALPQTRGAVNALAKAMRKPLTAKQAKDDLYQYMGDDEFFDDLDKAADEKVKDVRPIVKKHLKRLVADMQYWRTKPKQDIIDELELLTSLK